MMEQMSLFDDRDVYKRQVMRPTKEGPAMVFNRIKGHPGAKVAIGLLSSRTRVAALFGCRTEELGKKLWELSLIHI